MIRWPEGNRAFSYNSRTGSSWKGKIGLGEFNFNISSMKKNYSCMIKKAKMRDFGHPSPSGYRYHNNTISWRFTNFKPEPEWHSEAKYCSFGVSFKAKHPTKRGY
jgi:hypothetical protein